MDNFLLSNPYDAVFIKKGNRCYFMLVDWFAFPYGLFFVLAGISHFRNPEKFVEIVPSFLPYGLFLVYLTGVIEIAGGIGIMYPGSRIVSGRLMALFLVAVFPANLSMWINNIPFDGTLLTTQQHVIRSLIQLLLIIIALFISKDLTF